MDEIDVQDLVEAVASAAVKKYHPAHWLEDHISVELVIELTRQLQGLQYNSASGASNLRIHAYKARGARVEHIHGDIALLVNLAWADGTTLQGAGFYEAKRRDIGGNVYGALDHDQLRTYLAQTPHLSALLYDYQPITQFMNWPYGGPWCSPCCLLHILGNGPPHTHMLAVPADIVVARRDNSTSLYKHGVAFSYQFVVRHLNGFDLERADAVLNRVKGYGDDIGATPIVIIATKGIGTAPPDPPDLNPDLYQPLTEEDLPRLD